MISDEMIIHFIGDSKEKITTKKTTTKKTTEEKFSTDFHYQYVLLMYILVGWLVAD